MIEIHEATEDEAEHAAGILAEAFHHDPVLSWVFPAPEDRATLLPGLMRTFVDRALATDRVQLAGDLGVATWITQRGTNEHGTSPNHAGNAEPDGTEHGGETDELPAAYLPYRERLELLGKLLAECHPTDPTHLWLPMIGIRPDARGSGLGSALLTHRLNGTVPTYPAYLEASSERNRALYERHGFHAFGTPISLPEGPTIHPMWRPAGADDATIERTRGNI